MKTFFWELDSFGIQWWHYAGILGGIAGTPLTLYLNRLLDKKWTVILGVVGCVLAVTGPVMLDLAGIMLDKGVVLMWLLGVSARTTTRCWMAFLSAFAIAPVSVTVASMMGDMADEHELRKGTRQEGVYFAAFPGHVFKSTAADPHPQENYRLRGGVRAVDRWRRLWTS